MHQTSWCLCEAKVDFELMGGHILRQRVPQDWVLLAATSREIKALGPWDILRCLQCFGCLVSHLSCESPLAALDVSYPKDVAWSLLETRYHIAWNLPACIILLYRLPIIVLKKSGKRSGRPKQKNQRLPMFSHVFFHFFPWSCIYEIALSGLVLVVVVGQVWVLQMMLIDTNCIEH